MKCVELNAQLENEWTQFIEESQDACLGHDILWRKVIAESLGHNPRYLTALDNGKVRGILPMFEVRHRLLGNRLVSIPVLDQAGVLADSPDALESLTDGVQEMIEREHYSYAQLRLKVDPQYTEETNKAVLLLRLLEDPDSMWNSFKSKVRNQVRKAEKSGLTVEVGGSELAGDFYKVYSRNMRDLGVPALPVRLFDATSGAFGDRASIIIVRAGVEPVGGGVIVFFKDTASVPWASSSRKHFELCPNNLLYWTAIRVACERGCSMFDFGRSTRATGPFRFKLQWGAVPAALRWNYCTPGEVSMPDFTTSNPRFQILVRVWKHLPVPVANYLGSRISGQVA